MKITLWWDDFVHAVAATREIGCYCNARIEETIIVLYGKNWKWNQFQDEWFWGQIILNVEATIVLLHENALNKEWHHNVVFIVGNENSRKEEIVKVKWIIFFLRINRLC